MNIIMDLEDPYSDRDTLDLAILRNEISPIVCRFGSWVITFYGIENLDHYYQVAKERVHEEGWVDHIRAKRWSNHADFVAALIMAKGLWDSPEPPVMARWFRSCLS
tara:strand:+ start:16004 stop:16321 length:318 start_codon:yes stop_codon:yes gene_type:complete